jgi:uncharacterized protein (DUF58 family)
VKRAATPKLHAYLALAILLPVVAWGVGRPELALVGTPFAVIVLLVLARLEGPPRVEASLQLPRERALEGEHIPVAVTLRADRDVERLELVLSFPENPDWPPAALVAADLLRGEERRLDVPVDLRRWGALTSARVEMQVLAPLGLFRDRGSVAWRFVLRVYPRPETLRSVVTPRETQPSAGNLVARGVGSGIEFSEVRPFQAGDERRHVNWRATARRGELWVNARRPERNADLILFLDTFTDIGASGRASLDVAVRAAAALAQRYLRERDKVGVIGFGGTLSWLRPGTGVRQLYQISEALIATQVSFSYAWKDVSFIPRGTMPPQATVVALSPLVDERYVQALFDLLRRRFDVCVLEVRPEAFLAPARSRRERLARRIWLLEREALLDRYRELGASVVSLDGRRTLESAVDETLRFRRQARLVTAR